MKVCLCHDFDEVAAREAIKKHGITKPEELHAVVEKNTGWGSDPLCGTCLSLIQVFIDNNRETGTMPRALDVTPETRKAAGEKLGERYAQEEAGKPRPTGYKRLYIRRIKP